MQKKTKKDRADALLAVNGLAESRDAATRLVMAGKAFFLADAASDRWERVDKPGRMFPADQRFRLAEADRFVSRGGYKLLTALETFGPQGLSASGQVCLDAGASTGGFTDCLLQHGAERVYAVDVGTNQLHEKLRADPRVVSRENVNLRLAPDDLIPEKVGLIVADVSFISLAAILPSVLRWLADGGQLVALIKPQFELEAGRTDRGVVRDEASRQEAVDKVIAAAKTLGLDLAGLAPSAVLGPKGNQEYLAWFRQA